jgi:L-ascorbate metabolism protein UlaG (beta-lactamase superfamily)
MLPTKRKRTAFAMPRPMDGAVSVGVSRVLSAVFFLGSLSAVFVSVFLADRAGAQAAGSARIELTWFGQSCFLLQSANGTRILIDPPAKGTGYDLPSGLRVDLITISHEHADHNNVTMAVTPRVLHGLTADKKGWTKIDTKVKDVSVRSVGVYHDDKQGTERGLNTIFIFEVSGIRIAHLGDLGHVLDDRQLSAIGSVDVVLVPVGGATTIDAHQATRVIDQLRPRLTIVPMHYRTPTATATSLATVDEFLEGKSNVRRTGFRTMTLTSIKSRPAAEIAVMSYK